MLDESLSAPKRKRRSYQELAKPTARDMPPRDAIGPIYNLWVASIIARTVASKPEEKAGVFGERFLESYEFVEICDMLGIEADWLRKTLWPYAEGKQPLPRLNGPQGSQAKKQFKRKAPK